MPWQVNSLVGGGKSWRPCLALEQGWLKLPKVGLSTLRRPSSNALLKEVKKIRAFSVKEFIEEVYLSSLASSSSLPYTLELSSHPVIVFMISRESGLQLSLGEEFQIKRVKAI